jgi:protein TonB
MKIPAYVLAFAAFALPAAALADSRIEPPVPVRTVSPSFPNDLHDKGISGVVMVNVLIDQQGNPQDLKVARSSNSEFEGPALEALKKWKFKPAERDGSAVALRVVIPIRFSADD